MDRARDASLLTQETLVIKVTSGRHLCTALCLRRSVAHRLDPGQSAVVTAPQTRSSDNDTLRNQGPRATKKKGCKKKKCSHWKGGKCRCGRD